MHNEVRMIVYMYWEPRKHRYRGAKQTTEEQVCRRGPH